MLWSCIIIIIHYSNILNKKWEFLWSEMGRPHGFSMKRTSFQHRSARQTHSDCLWWFALWARHPGCGTCDAWGCSSSFDVPGLVNVYKKLWLKSLKSQFLMGKLTISIAIFNSYVKLPEGKYDSSWLMFYNYNNTWWLLTQSSFDLSIIKYHYDITHDKSKDNYINIHTYMHACMHTYIHTFIHTYIHTYIHSFIHTYIHTYIHTFIHIHTYSTHRQTDGQTDIHTYITLPTLGLILQPQLHHEVLAEYVSLSWLG